MFCSDEEGKGLTKPVGDSLRPPAGPRTCGARHAVCQPPADPFLFIYPRPPGPRAPAHTPQRQRSPHTLAAAANAFAVASRSSSARPTRAEKERLGWPPRWSKTLGWTPSRSGLCSRTSEHLSSPLLLLPACLPVCAFAYRRPACPPACSGTRIDICSISLAPGVGFSFAVAQLPAPPDLAAIGTRARFGSRRLFSTTEFAPVIIPYHVLVSPSHMFDAL
jgi:hypothetical protein